MKNHIIKNIPNSLQKQQGSTLLTVMVFLVLMTIVTVSATKISILDVLVSGNDQQKVIAFQVTENNLTQFATTAELADALEAGVFPDQQFRTGDSTPNFSKTITDMTEQYPCERGGQGSSIGGGAPPCSLYDYQVWQQQQSTGTKEDHHKGGGKMVPAKGSKYNAITLD